MVQKFNRLQIIPTCDRYRQVVFKIKIRLSSPRQGQVSVVSVYKSGRKTIFEFTFQNAAA